MALIADCIQDVRFAVRMWRRNPGFAIAAVATFALGVGANAAIFSIVSGVLLRPLPFADPARLVRVNGFNVRENLTPVTYGDLDSWRAESRTVAEFSGCSVTSLTLEQVDEPEQLPVVRSDRRFFRLMGVQPTVGRTFQEEDDSRVAVVSAGFARRRLGGTERAVGKRVVLDGDAYLVIGVMPEGFQFPYRASPAELWLPSDDPPQDLRARRRVELTVARLRPNVSAEAARQELESIARRSDPVGGVRITPLAEMVTGKVRTPLLVLLGAVVLVLIVACANIANMLTSRGVSRAREIAIRESLGAGRLRLARQFVAEGALLTVTGAAAGLAAGRVLCGMLLRLAAAQIPRSAEIGLDWRMFAFLLCVTVGASVFLGLLPARQRQGRSRSRFRDSLVVVEVALAFILLAGAGLLLRTFLNLQHQPVGLRAENVLTLHTVVKDAAAIRELEERVARTPGVRSAAFISYLPLQVSGWTAFVNIDGQLQEGLVELRYVTPSYFETMGVPVVRGRGLNAADVDGAQKAVLVNQAFVRRYFPNRDPLGQEIRYRGTIVGVTGDVRQAAIGTPAVPELYYPFAQNFAQQRSNGVSMVVRTYGKPEASVGTVLSTIREWNRNQPVFRVRTMEQVVAESTADLKLYLWLLGIFGVTGLLLASAGIYGVMSFAVNSRVREFGVRMALGAEPGTIVGLLLGHGARLAVMGVVLGSAGAVGMTRVLGGLLFGVTPVDPVTYGTMSVMLGASAVGACVAPALRASRVDPAVALRCE